MGMATKMLVSGISDKAKKQALGDIENISAEDLAKVLKSAGCKKLLTNPYKNDTMNKEVENVTNRIC